MTLFSTICLILVSQLSTADELPRDAVKIVKDQLTDEVLELGRAFSYQRAYLTKAAASGLGSANRWKKRNDIKDHTGWSFPLLDLSRAKDKSFGYATGKEQTLSVYRVTDKDRGVVYAYAKFGDRRITCSVIGVDASNIVEDDKLTIELPVLFIENRWKNDYNGEYLLYTFSESQVSNIELEASFRLRNK